MKKSILPLVLMIVLAAPLIASGASNDTAKAGGQFVELLATNDFAGAEIQFDDTMKAALPQSKLQETWQAIEAQAGPFQKQLQTRVLKFSGYDLALVSCQFERATLDVKVVFDTKQRVTGLFFVNVTALYVAQFYADTNTFREILFTVGHGQWQLPGILTLPKNGKEPWPAVVLVHGSGPEDRDETIGGNKPFRDLAWGLASKGIAVLRYEKRTRQHPITNFWDEGLGQFTVRDETMDDAVSAVAELRARDDIEAKRIFVLGHSLGGMVAPRIAQDDPQIAGLVILAAPARPFADVITEQTRYLISLNGKPSTGEEAYLAQVEAQANQLRQLTAADASSKTILFGAPVAYWLDMRGHDPLAAAKEISQPMLFLQGGRDYQVTTNDFELWKTALANHPHLTFKLYPQLNHLFVAGTGKSVPSEYEQPGHVDEQVVNDVARWILTDGGL